MLTQNKITKRIGPQAGPQYQFLSTKADVAFYGGGAGGGKSFALMLEPVRHYDNPKFGGVIFRKNMKQVRNEGGLWDESLGLYGPLGATPKETTLEWQRGTGWRMKFDHLEHEMTVLNWQGSAVPYIGFDEITHFSEKQVFYMMSRLRSMSGVPGYMRGTCNPDAASWVRRFIDWWIGPDGFPIRERSGVIRWFIRQDDEIVWADSKEELVERFGADSEPKSFTFIQSLIHDNKILMTKDPTYIASLKALPRVERMRLLEGNWNVVASAGSFFKREWFEVVETLPAGKPVQVRYWDKAATKPSPTNKNPDWTRGLKLLRYPNGVFVVADLKSMRDTPLKVERLVFNTASQEHDCPVVVEQDPGSAGVADAANYTRLLAGFIVRVRKPTADKKTRALPASAQAEAGNIKLLRAPWNEEFLLELENFPDGSHDDIVDVLSGAVNELTSGRVAEFSSKFLQIDENEIEFEDDAVTYGGQDQW